jgi:hypothetical protein
MCRPRLLIFFSAKEGKKEKVLHKYFLAPAQPEQNSAADGAY